MAKIRQQTFNVTATGVGRKDYSQQVEYSVEPVVRSYQSSYVLDEVYTVGASSTRTIEVDIPVSTVVLLYDFLASCTANKLLGFKVSAIDSAGVTSAIFSKHAYQKIEHHHSRGAPVLAKIEIELINVCDTAIDIYVTLVGIVTGIKEYYQTVST